MPSCPNIDTARIGANPELVPAPGIGVELRLSFGRSEPDRIRTPMPSATSATTKP
jgi:hypothetical protein